jgi:hypothetical protein
MESFDLAFEIKISKTEILLTIPAKASPHHPLILSDAKNSEFNLVGN